MKKKIDKRKIENKMLKEMKEKYLSNKKQEIEQLKKRIEYLEMEIKHVG